MMNRYQEFEQTVFNWLMEKHKKDQNFTFSVRQQANKGAEDDYFIGTENSNYFSTTFWYIPVAYPGNANELIGVIFRLSKQGFSYRCEFRQSKSPHNDQNRIGLELIKRLKPIIKQNFSNFSESNSESKSEFYKFDSPKPVYRLINEMLEDFNSQLEKLLTIVNNEIENMQGEHSEFIAHRFTQKEFDIMLKKLESRRSVNKVLKENVSLAKNEKMISTEKKEHPLNQILFGPPGTGKTYNTINSSLRITDEDFYSRNKDQRALLSNRFKDLLITDWSETQGRIAFITFHQNMSYEDFIEGIKPLKPKENEHLKYDIEDGIFKKICKKAISNYESSLLKNKGKIPFEDAFEQLKDEWENDASIKFPLKTEGYDFTIIGFTNTSIQFKKASGGTSHTLSINTLKEIYYGKEINFKQGVGIYYPSVLNKLFSYQKRTNSNTDLLSYVLIIDEINRGNVSQIFGELITLIEDDKRIGSQEELEIMLPYSKEKFSVPPNLYIIGTMNTADRSVEALDTALRRRFIFKEIMPDPGLLCPQELIIRLYEKYPDTSWDDKAFRKEASELYELIGIDESYETKVRQDDAPDYADDSKIRGLDIQQFSGINLQLLLLTINSRIQKLLDSDHQIGHAFFINTFSRGKLYTVFYQKLIPQLQEYFYGDFGKIGLVLGNDFIRTKKLDSTLFADFQYEDKSLLLEKKLYEIHEYKTNGDVEWNAFMNAAKNIYLPKTEKAGA